jgi:hypothetical protein
MNSLPDVIDALEARFNSLGIPAFGSPAERQSFLDALTNVETLLNKPTNSLPSDADTQLRNLIAAMRAAVP